MLCRLVIRDFVLVEALELDFQPGFGALTGETGAGKSILIDALQLVLGARADTGVIREGATRAEISAEFGATADARLTVEIRLRRLSTPPRGNGQPRAQAAAQFGRSHSRPSFFLTASSSAMSRASSG